MFTRCAGLAVQKKSSTACRRLPEPTGHEAAGILALRTFGMMPRALLGLADGLPAARMTHGAMGKPGRGLAARLPSPRRHLAGVFGQRGPRPDCARTEDRPGGGPLARQTDTLWPMASVFHPAHRATSRAGSHPLADDARARARP